MSRTRIQFAFRLALVALAVTAAPGAAGASTPNSNYADEAYARVNAERTRRGAGALVRLRLAELTAQLHAMDMANREYMAHYTKATPSPVVPDPRGYPGIQFTAGMDPADRLRRCGFSEASRGWGENVGYNWGYESGSPADIVRRWMESPSHEENILDRSFKGTGVGCAVSASGKVYYAQVFVAYTGGATLSSNASLWSSTPPPATDTTAPAGWASFAVVKPAGNSFRVTVRDSGSGLAPATAQFRYSTNGGGTWSAWQTAGCTGSQGATTTQQLATPALSLSPTAGQNRVQFQVKDVAGNTGTSPAFTPPARKKRR
jgi:uncharacterized protein YkwD